MVKLIPEWKRWYRMFSQWAFAVSGGTDVIVTGYTIQFGDI